MPLQITVQNKSYEVSVADISPLIYSECCGLILCLDICDTAREQLANPIPEQIIREIKIAVAGIIQTAIAEIVKSEDNPISVAVKEQSPPRTEDSLFLQVNGSAQSKSSLTIQEAMTLKTVLDSFTLLVPTLQKEFVPAIMKMNAWHNHHEFPYSWQNFKDCNFPSPVYADEVSKTPSLGNLCLKIIANYRDRPCFAQFFQSPPEEQDTSKVPLELIQEIYAQ
jgi:hypothetical protein